MKAKIGKQRTVTGAYSPDYNEKGDKLIPNMGYDLSEIDNHDPMNTSGFTGPAPKGKSPK